MCCYDVAAREVLDVCRELNISVPEEIAVVGVDNDEVLCEVSQPPLTSVALDTRRIGIEAASMLDRLMHGESVGSPVIVEPCGIVTRRSSDTLAIEDRHIAVALGFIRRHACEGIEVSDVLAQVPLSRRTLERRFRQQVGCSPLAEINRVRLDRAKQFLKETELKLDAIAAHSGFAHTPYMAAQFRKQFGVTPGEYRKTHRSP
jgi:LacI family transcriptional regulator